ncbi:uncharacterized protein FIBRA_03492 [Fibroporia radiculosa]|uniref:MOSC domain-containing protein n=1 Tax=Fibroporia radiculosa TaxID=599839 RepID=J4GNI3_9APHY|nr:uncharacterized protein FIBRA_03492 [Fibroporia radiculosa]CCM01440.1 predicted protein [Fibroporia radiculosa]
MHEAECSAFAADQMVAKYVEAAHVPGSLWHYLAPWTHPADLDDSASPRAMPLTATDPRSGHYEAPNPGQERARCGPRPELRPSALPRPVSPPATLPPPPRLRLRLRLRLPSPDDPADIGAEASRVTRHRMARVDQMSCWVSTASDIVAGQWHLFLPVAILCSSLIFLPWRSSPAEKNKGDVDSDSTVAGIIDKEYVTEVPFHVGEVRVSRIFVHPIKVQLPRDVSVAGSFHAHKSRGERDSTIDCRKPHKKPLRSSAALPLRQSGSGVSSNIGLNSVHQNDRKWCIVDAQTKAIITAREFPKIVLIIPRLDVDSSSSHGGSLTISFPKESGCSEFSVPIAPTPDMLRKWEVLEGCKMHRVIVMDGYVSQSISSPPHTPTKTLSEYFGKPVHLLMKGPTPRECVPTSAFPDLKATALYTDGYPLHVASEESLAEFQRVVQGFASKGQDAAIGGLDHERWSKGAVEMERFRPNIVFKGAGVPFAEDFWRTVVLHSSGPTASSELTLLSKCTRCLLPNVDAHTGVRDAAVPLKVLFKFRMGKARENTKGACFGCNGMLDRSGVVKVGDLVTVKEWTDLGGV